MAAKDRAHGGLDGRPRSAHVAGRIDDPRRCGTDKLDESLLGGDPLFGVGLRRAAPDQPVPLHRRVAGDQPDLVAQLGQPALDELDRLHDDRGGTLFLGGGDSRENPRPHRGMDDRLKVTQRRRIGEDDPSQRRPIELAVGAHQPGPEPTDDRIERWLPGFEHLAGDAIGIDDDDAGSLTEPARHG